MQAGKSFFIDAPATSRFNVEAKLLTELGIQQEDKAAVSKSSEFFLAFVSADLFFPPRPVKTYADILVLK